MHFGNGMRQTSEIFCW